MIEQQRDIVHYHITERELSSYSSAVWTDLKKWKLTRKMERGGAVT
jgi:hypothetical protein